MSNQPDEYDTPTSDVQTSSGPTIPPLVPPKTKTRDRPQLTTATTEQYDRPTLPKVIVEITVFTIIHVIFSLSHSLII